MYLCKKQSDEIGAGRRRLLHEENNILPSQNNH